MAILRNATTWKSLAVYGQFEKYTMIQ